MKDLIAKLQMDANCALGAIWMHIEAREKRIAELEAQQAFGIGETYANALSRIAELEAQLSQHQAARIAYASEFPLDADGEPDIGNIHANIRTLKAQIAAASALVVDQHEVAEITECDAYPDHSGRIEAFAFLPIGTKLYAAPQPADTDKLREAIYQFQHRDSPIIWTDVDAYVYETQVAGGDQSRVRKVFLADQMALQAPVREVPGWQPIETAPKDGTRIMIFMGAPWARIVTVRWFDLWENWQEGDFPEDKEEYCGIGSLVPTHWMPLPSPPEADK